MQFYLNGFRPGDPEIAQAGPYAHPQSESTPPQEVDVLIVGCGPAGLLLAAQLSAFPDIRTAIVERKNGPLELGQADGIACRTVETLEAFGLSAQLLREAYWVNETVFWRPSEEHPGHIRRSGRVADTEPGLSEFPHVIVNQARVHSYLLDRMTKSANRLTPTYGYEVTGLEVTGSGDHPVHVTLEPSADNSGGGGPVNIRARYVVGCDGARSTVRRAIGRQLAGDSANQVWGVMDVLADTSFPDIRNKAVIQSATDGNIVLIPREGGYLFRLYIELHELEAGQRVVASDISLDILVEKAQRIFFPYTLDVREVAWWSVYEIGQRLTDSFDDDDAQGAPRVFIAGDACHTHSPKAGQGMNVSMQDTYNLGWKLAAVLRGQADPGLLTTYTAERQRVAQELIDFDREWATIVSAPARSERNPDGVDPEVVQRYFVDQGRYTAGLGTQYLPSAITAQATHQQAAVGFPIGRRFHSAPVTRIADARPMELGHVAKADGRWRVYLFGETLDVRDPRSELAALCDYLETDPASPIRRFTDPLDDVDALFDVRGIVRTLDPELTIDGLPQLLRPRKGYHSLVDYEKAFRPAAHVDIFAERAIASTGAIVIVRPDQYVAQVLPLSARREVGDFFAGFMIPRR